MSDTPETDCEVNDKSYIYTMGGLPPVVVHVEFARNLERERDEARFDLAFRRELYAVQELQLAEARKTISELQQKAL